MPATPKIAGARGEIGKPEVEAEVKAHQAGQPARHVGVAREVPVDLKGKSQRRDPQLGSRVGPHVLEHRVGERGRVVGDDHLLEQAPQDEPETGLDLAQVDPPRALDLRQEATAAFDWTGDQLREEGDVEREVQGVLGRLRVSPVDVDGVAHRLEGVEGDTDRKDEAQRGHGPLDAHHQKQVVEALDEKIEVLEEREDREVADDRDRRPPLANGLVFRPRDAPTGDKVDGRAQPNEPQKLPAPRAVKDVARQQQQQVLNAQTARREQVQRVYEREEPEENPRVKQHDGRPSRSSLRRSFAAAPARPEDTQARAGCALKMMRRAHNAQVRAYFR